MKTLMKAGLSALLVGSAFVLPIQEAGAATTCYTVVTHGVAKKVCTPVNYRTVCTTNHGVKTCHKVAY